MPKLSDEQRNNLENLTVGLLLELRREYLAAGASPLKHWDQLQSRLLASTRAADGVPEWLAAMCRGLQLEAPRSQTCLAASRLEKVVREFGSSTWLDLVEREYSYLLAKARLESERQRALKDGGMNELLNNSDEGMSHGD